MHVMSYYDDAPQRKDHAAEQRVLLILSVVNATFAGTSVFLWTFLSLFVAEPIQWATWRGISSRPDLIEYPFILLWMLPAAGIVAGWIAKRAGQMRIACWLAFFPIILLGLIFGWFYMAPIGWR